jgi:hypothetical protein
MGDPSSLRSVWNPGSVIFGGVESIDIVVCEHMSVWFHSWLSNISL